MVEIGNAKGNAIDKPNLGVHALNKTASNAMGEKIENTGRPVCQGIAKGMEGRKG